MGNETWRSLLHPFRFNWESRSLLNTPLSPLLHQRLLFLQPRHTPVGTCHGAFLPTNMTTCGEVGPVSEIHGVWVLRSIEDDFDPNQSPPWSVRSLGSRVAAHLLCSQPLASKIDLPKGFSMFLSGSIRRRVTPADIVPPRSMSSEGKQGCQFSARLAANEDVKTKLTTHSFTLHGQPSRADCRRDTVHNLPK